MQPDGLRKNISLAPLTTLRIGGPAASFAAVKNEAELVDSITFAKANNLPVMILGGGSNVLVLDSGFGGLLIKNEIGSISYKDQDNFTEVTAGAGIVWDELVADTVRRGLWGLENLSAIPGTVGATPIQNVGAYGVEAGELIRSVRAYDSVADKFVVLSREECHFAYRDSYFKTSEGRRLFIVSVTYRLDKNPAPRLEYKDLAGYFGTDSLPSVKQIRAAIIKIRGEKFPDLKIFGTAGSFFKNPIIQSSEAESLRAQYPELPTYQQLDGKVKISLGYVLDKICHLRGFRLGNVGLYENQALVLVNYGQATAAEVIAFTEKISQIVFEKTKIRIEFEVNVI